MKNTESLSKMRYLWKRNIMMKKTVEYFTWNE